jgi:hypothetical protein
MKLRYILPAVVAVFMVFGYYSDPVDTPEPEIKHAIKLTIRHLPIHKYWADDDDDDSLTIAQQYMIVNRHTSVKTKTDITPAEDDYVLSDEIRLRLMLARFKALEVHQKHHGVS